MRFFLFLSLFSLVSNVAAQYFNMGQSPAGLKWKKIETPHFKLIFPDDYTNQAQVFANHLEKAYPKVAHSLNGSLRKIPVVIHNQGMRSNGFVAWAPKRMELFPMPAQNNLASDYMQHLSIHELRHVVQMYKLHESFSKYLYPFFGEQIYGALAGIYLPLWFLEGDAVCTETSLTHAGRGRSPEFNYPLIAQILENGIYSYDKAVFGSYKDFVPNHYTLGYHITAHARAYYGKEVWANVLQNVAKKPYGLVSFSRGLKKHTGLNKTQLYYAALDSLSLRNKTYQKEIKNTFFKTISLPKTDYTNHSKPIVLENNSIVSIRSSYGDINQLVLFENGKETLIKRLGFAHSHTLTYRNNKIYFIEDKPDKRWQHRNYANIATFDMQSKRTKTLTKKGRYQALALSPDSNTIAALHTNTQGESSLHLLKTSDGKNIKEIPINNYYIIDPVWVNNNIVLFIAQNESGKAIMTLNTDDYSESILKPFAFEEISTPLFYNGFIVYSSSISGINNIYALDTSSTEVFQLTSSAFGAKNAVFDTSSTLMFYLNYTAQGNAIVKTPVDSLLWLPLEKISMYENKVLDVIVAQEKGIIDFENMPDSVYEVKKYNRFLNFLKIHSWAPAYIDVGSNTTDFGNIAFSQNLLSTTTSSLGYKYNTSEKTGSLIAHIEYAGLYPKFNSSLAHGKRRIASADTTRLWQELKITAGTQIPFLFTKGQYIRQLVLFGNNNHIEYTPLENQDTLNKIAANAFDYGFVFRNFRHRAYRDLHPKFAQQLTVRYAHSPLSDNNLGYLWAVRGTFYFPGLFRHNSLFFSTSYQKRKAGDLSFSYIFPLARGHENTHYKYSEAITVQTNYALPLLYPDFSIGGLFYIKRLKGLLFFDYSALNNKRNFLRSYGLELSAETHVLRFIAPVNFGVRTSYNQNTGKISAEPLFSINFDAL